MHLINISPSKWNLHWNLLIQSKSANLLLGVIQQRRPTKNWLFGPPPPCPASSVWQSPSPPGGVSDSKTDYRNNKKEFSGQKNVFSGQKNVFLDVRLIADPPPPSVRGRPLWPAPSPTLSTGRLWWMVPYRLFFKRYIFSKRDICN